MAHVYVALYMHHLYLHCIYTVFTYALSQIHVFPFQGTLPALGLAVTDNHSSADRHSPSLLGQANARDQHERGTSFLEKSPLPFRGGWDGDQVTFAFYVEP